MDATWMYLHLSQDSRFEDMLKFTNALGEGFVRSGVCGFPTGSTLTQAENAENCEKLRPNNAEN